MAAQLQPKGMVALPASLVASVPNNRHSTGAAAEALLKEKAPEEFSWLSLALVTRWCFSSRLSVSGLCCRVFCHLLEEEPWLQPRSGCGQPTGRRPSAVELVGERTPLEGENLPWRACSALSRGRFLPQQSVFYPGPKVRGFIFLI